LPSVVYQFRAVGAENIARAYERIAEAQKKAMRAKAGAGVYGGGASRSGGGGGGGGMSAEQRAAKEAEKAAEREVRAKARAESAKLRSAEMASKAAERLRISSYKAESRALDKAETEKTRLMARAEKDRKRSQERSSRDAAKLNKEMAAIERRDMAEHMRHREAQAKKWKQRAASLGGAGSAAAWGIAGGVASLGIAAGGAFAGVAGASVRERMLAKDQAIALSNAGRGSGQAGVGGDALLADATKVALQVKGTKTTDVLGSMAKYVQMTGDLSGARSNAKTFAIAARATGSSEEDIASTAATLRDKFGIKDTDGMRNALAALTGQGKDAAFELKDASQYLTEMGAAGARFGVGQGEQGVRTLGGLSQIAMKATGKGAQASTAVQALMRQMVGQSAKIKSTTGASVFMDSSNTKTNDIGQTITKMIGGAGGDQVKLQKALGDADAVKAISPLMTAYNEAAGSTSGSAADKRAAGEAAVSKMLDETINAAGTWKDILVDYAAATDTAGATLTTAWEKLSSDVGDSLAPAFTQIVTAIAPLAGSLKPFAEAVAIATDRAVGFAKKMGWVEEEKPAELSTVPKADLYDATSRLAALDAKEKKLGGLTPADQNKRAELQARQLELKDQLVAADPSLLTPDEYGTRFDAKGNKIPGKGPDTGLSRIMRGEGLESRSEQVAAGGKLPPGVNADAHDQSADVRFAKDLAGQGWLGRAATIGGLMVDNVVSGRSLTSTPGDEDRRARAEAIEGDYGTRRGGGASGGGKVDLNDSELIGALRSLAGAVNGGNFSTKVK
jgi:hypothetical protein